MDISEDIFASTHEGAVSSITVGDVVDIFVGIALVIIVAFSIHGMARGIVLGVFVEKNLRACVSTLGHLFGLAKVTFANTVAAKCYFFFFAVLDIIISTITIMIWWCCER